MLISFFPADEVQRLSRPRGLVPVAQDSNEIRKIEGDCSITILLPNIAHERFSSCSSESLTGTSRAGSGAL